MLDPDKLETVEKRKPNINQRTIEFKHELPEFDKEEYDLFNDKSFKKYMKKLEDLVRGSFEYRSLVKYCREFMNMNKCSFFENVNNIDTFKIKIELHHTPFGLYDICKIVFNKRSYYHEPLNPELVAEEVVLLHYCGMVGLIPLSQTVHELVHNYYLFVPTSSVMGRYKDFIDMYEQFFDPEHIDILDRIENYSKTYNNAIEMNILQRDYTHLDFSGAYRLPKLDDIANIVSDRIIEIKKGYNIPLNEQLSNNLRSAIIFY